MQTDFLALYRGQTISEARIIAVSADPRIVERFASELAGDVEPERGGDTEQRELHLVPDGAGE